MFNYSKLAYQLKREVKTFSNKISKGLSQPKYKLVFQMLYGMLESQSTHLSKISRALKEDITLVVVYGFGEIPMMLISNIKTTDKRLPVIIAKVYLMRWRIEEYYRFKKQQFGFEDFRVQSLNSIRALNTFLFILSFPIFFILSSITILTKRFLRL